MASLSKRLGRAMKDGRKAGYGFVGAQIAAALGAKSASFSLRGGGRLTLRGGSSDAEVLREVFVDGAYDIDGIPQGERVRARYAEILNSGATPVIVDAGANIGAAAAYFARAFPRAAVVAVEPEPNNCALCRANLAGFANVRVEEAAIGAAPGRVRIERPEAYGDWGARTERVGGAEGVPVRSVAELVALVPGGVLLMLKSDIEGFEADLFAANLDWLDEAAAVLVELHDWMLPGRYSSHALQRAMAAGRWELVPKAGNLFYVR